MNKLNANIIKTVKALGLYALCFMVAVLSKYVVTDSGNFPAAYEVLVNAATLFTLAAMVVLSCRLCGYGVIGFVHYAYPHIERYLNAE